VLGRELRPRPLAGRGHPPDVHELLRQVPVELVPRRHVETDDHHTVVRMRLRLLARLAAGVEVLLLPAPVLLLPCLEPACRLARCEVVEDGPLRHRAEEAVPFVIDVSDGRAHLVHHGLRLRVTLDHQAVGNALQRPDQSEGRAPGLRIRVVDPQRLQDMGNGNFDMCLHPLGPEAVLQLHFTDRHGGERVTEWRGPAYIAARGRAVLRADPRSTNASQERKSCRVSHLLRLPFLSGPGRARAVGRSATVPGPLLASPFASPVREGRPRGISLA
jgi:hypothetical protein